MSKYPTVKLGDVCIIERGGSPRPINKFITKDPNGINWIKIGDTSADSMYITKTAEKIIPEGVLKSRQVKKGDFILSNSMSFGRPYILNIDGCIHDGWLLIRDINDIFEKQFLYYYLSSETVYANLKQMAVGGVVNNLNSNKVRSLMVPVLKKEDQVKICNKLNKITTVIQQRKQQLSKLDELAKSRFIEMFGQCGEDRFGWGVSKLGDYCIINPSKSTEARLEDELEVSFCPMPYVSESGDIKTDETKLYKDVKSGFTYFAEEDVLFAKITPCMENGKGAIARNLKNGIGFGSTEFHILRPNRNIITPEWLYVLTTFKQFRKDAEANMTGSAGQKRVPSIFLRNYKISIPPLEMQKQYVGILEQLDKSKFRIKKSLEKLEMTYKALLQEYFG